MFGARREKKKKEKTAEDDEEEEGSDEEEGMDTFCHFLPTFWHFFLLDSQQLLLWGGRRAPGRRGGPLLSVPPGWG